MRETEQRWVELAPLYSVSGLRREGWRRFLDEKSCVPISHKLRVSEPHTRYNPPRF